ncbi:MAG: recombinase family protein [Clostridiales bacterium]|nr:recombinase family protein [Clostridiales bacterium]
MKAVIYARYSSDNQREESIEGQIRECTAYCEKNDIIILQTYIDRALSAKTDNRPDFQRMIKDSAKGLFDVIIVWKLDRFARNRYDSAHYKAQLRKNGVKVLSATENISEGPEGIILESLLEGMAEYYSAELSEKVIRGHTENALKCMYNGGTPTFGYMINEQKHYQIDPHAAPIVLEIFKRYDQGATVKEIRDWMNEIHVGTRNGKPITLNFVMYILHNRRYIGEYSYRNIITPNGIPAIVPEELFDRVQRRLERNKRAPARHKAEDDYLLTTKLFCGTCGAMMVGECGTSSAQGRKYHYYRCVNSKKRKTCTAKHKSVRKQPIEDAVINAVIARIMDDNFVEYIADAVMNIQSKENSTSSILEKQQAEIERGINNLLNAVQMGMVSTSIKQRLDELEEAKRDVEFRIAQEKIDKPLLSREDVIFWMHRFRKLDMSTLKDRKQLVDSFVNSVTIYDDYILITFNYKEGETTLSFSDIESSDLNSNGGPKKTR